MVCETVWLDEEGLKAMTLTIKEFDNHLEDPENIKEEIGRSHDHWRLYKKLHCIFCGKNSVWYSRKNIGYYDKDEEFMPQHWKRPSDRVDVQTLLICISCDSSWISNLCDVVAGADRSYVGLGQYIRKKLEERGSSS